MLLALLLTILPAAIAVQTAMVQLIGRAAPDVAARFAPGHPRVVSARVQDELADGMGEVSARTKAAAREAMRRAPMLTEPLLLAGIDHLQRGETERARQFLDRVLARDPRSELARLLMLELDLRSGDVNRAVFDMAILGRMLPDFHSVFVPELARLARDPRTGRALAATLRSDPNMLAGVLRHLASSGADARLVLELSKALPATTGPDIADWREPLLRAMIERGDYGDAQRLWAAFAGLDADLRGHGVYDGRFRGAPGLPPFNWSLASGEYGAAELERNGGLQVEYYGRDPGMLAGQLILLTPGRYRLAYRAEGDIRDARHRLVWKVECSGKGAPALAEIPLANLTYEGRTIAADFAVPANCPAQWLRLYGQPTEFPKVENALIREIRVQRLGGRA